jgi:AraC family transcriptional regulator
LLQYSPMNERAYKAKASTEYTRRINKALEFIHQNLDQPIRLDDVAGASCFSAFHFHRIFHALVGETVNDYVSRKRMERAVSRLVRKPGLSVTDVAVAGGFSSSANFSKAFKLYFGISPTDLRNSQSDRKNNSKIGKLFSKYGKAFNPQDLYSQFLTKDFVFDPKKLEEMLMKVRVEEQQEKNIAFLTAPKGYELDSIFST